MTADYTSHERDIAAQRLAVGQRLREWRLKREFSQAEVARSARITQASLSNYETGKRDMPLSTFLGVVAALDVSVGDLLEIPDVIVVRASRIGGAVERLVARPELTDRLCSRISGTPPPGRTS